MRRPISADLVVDALVGALTGKLVTNHPPQTTALRIQHASHVHSSECSHSGPTSIGLIRATRHWRDSSCAMVREIGFRCGRGREGRLQRQTKSSRTNILLCAPVCSIKDLKRDRGHKCLCLSSANKSTISPKQHRESRNGNPDTMFGGQLERECETVGAKPYG